VRNVVQATMIACSEKGAALDACVFMLCSRHKPYCRPGNARTVVLMLPAALVSHLPAALPRRS
jgi:hypothetical protein